MKYLFIAICFFCSFASFAQTTPTKIPTIDKSPLDISYCPKDYPKLKLNGKTKEGPIARVIYGRPQKNNRVIFDGLVKYNEVWRMGANEATEIEFFKNVKVGGKSVPKGRYTLYCIPTADKWTIILNKDNFCWGSYAYDLKADLLRTDVKVEKNTEVVEAFSMYFEDGNNSSNLVMLWDDVKAVLPITM